MSAGAIKGLAAGASIHELDSTARLTLDAIMKLTRGGQGRAALRAISTESGLSVPAISKAVKRLETSGVLVAKRPAGAGRATVYEVTENARTNYTGIGASFGELPDCFRSHDFIRPGWLWVTVPKGVPMRLGEVHKYAVVSHPSTTDRHLGALRRLPVPAVTRAVDPTAPRFYLYTFHDLTADDQAIILADLHGRIKKWRPKTKTDREAEHEAERQALRQKHGEASYVDLAPEILKLSTEDSRERWRWRLDTPCWLYGGELSASGYGVVEGVRSRGIRAHRITYTAERGATTPGKELHHRCEEPACVRPSHLWELWPDEHARETAMSQYRRQTKKNFAKFVNDPIKRQAADARAAETFRRLTKLKTPIGTVRQA